MARIYETTRRFNVRLRVGSSIRASRDHFPDNGPKRERSNANAKRVVDVTG